jgi:hypothetical protein
MRWVLGSTCSEMVKHPAESCSPGTQDANWGQGDNGRGSFHAAEKSATRAAGGVVNRLECEDCGTVFYSAAARTLVEQGQACAKCSGRLVVQDGPGPRPVPVNGPAARGRDAD